MTSRVQTPHPISSIFNRLPEGTIDNRMMKNEEAVSKTVGAGLPRGRQTHTHTHRHTHTDTDTYMTNFMMGNYKQNIHKPLIPVCMTKSNSLFLAAGADH